MIAGQSASFNFCFNLNTLCLDLSVSAHQCFIMLTIETPCPNFRFDLDCFFGFTSQVFVVLFVNPTRFNFGLDFDTAGLSFSIFAYDALIVLMT